MESFWRFTIPSLALSVPLLVVGITSEPSVFLGSSQVNFKGLLLKRRAIEQVKIYNKEAVPFKIAFDKKCLTAYTQSAMLQVEPMQATIPPNSR